MKKKYILYVLILSMIMSQEFNPGPYGIEYFDIAGPFHLTDLNNDNKFLGDVNEDDALNINDIIIIIGIILENIDLGENEYIADLNQDESIDVLDITLLLDRILYPNSYVPENSWDFETEWNGEETYMFIHYDPSNNNSVNMWSDECPTNICPNGSDRLTLLEKSTLNTHYFFISTGPNAEQDIMEIKADFERLITDNLSEEMKIHWKKYLHFIPIKTENINNWIKERLNGNYAFSIDRFQRIRQAGYLGNPAGFSGFYMNFLTHEVTYYNYEWNVFDEDPDTYDEITVFEKEHYTGGWASTISQLVEFPNLDELNNYSGMAIELLRGCPDANGNYSDQGCDDYDRIARMFICDEDESNCNEIARWITPFDRQPHHLTDISSFISMLKPGGNKIVKFQESGWPNSLLTMRFRFYHHEDITDTPQEFQQMWIGTIPFNPDYDENTPPIVFNVPDNATKVEFVSYITGHGWGSNGTYNCAEFCNSKHIFAVNGGVGEFEVSYPEAGDLDYCMEPGTIVQGVKPNQYGTWGYGRAGWCPGQDVHPMVTDITDYVSIGDENVMQYTACRQSWNDCVAPPVCPNNDCYCPEIAMTSYIIIWY